MKAKQKPKFHFITLEIPHVLLEVFYSIQLGIYFSETGKTDEKAMAARNIPKIFKHLDKRQKTLCNKAYNFLADKENFGKFKKEFKKLTDKMQKKFPML